MAIFSIESIAFDYQQQDKGLRPFIFVHGNTQNDTCGKAIKDYFYARGHSVLSYDLPGHGESKLAVEHYQFSDLIELNRTVLNHFNLSQPILCGHSLGGMIQCATLVAEQLKTASLILCGSYDANPVEAAKRQSQTAEALAIDAALQQYINDGFALFKRQQKFDYFANRAMEDDIVGLINRRYTQPLANQYNLTSLVDFNVREQLQRLSVPMLLLHGQAEDVIPPVLIESMLTDYANIAVGWYPQRGHYAFYQQPELTNAYLDQHYSLIAA
jgi:pimeloyl-ACP methyl ester carboxylesterase